jgi:hypothetical protein
MAFAWTKVVVGALICAFSIVTFKEIVYIGKQWMFSSGPLLVVLAIILWVYPLYLNSFFPVVEKSTTGLLLLLLSMGATFLLSYSLVIGCNSERRREIRDIFVRDMQAGSLAVHYSILIAPYTLFSVLSSQLSVLCVEVWRRSFVD